MNKAPKQKRIKLTLLKFGILRITKATIPVDEVKLNINTSNWMPSVQRLNEEVRKFNPVLSND